MWNYLLTILNSNYEVWRMQNPEKPYWDFSFSLEKMSNSGALFDINKLNDLSKEILSQKKADEIYEKLSAWAQVYNPEFANVLKDNRGRAIGALGIGRNIDKVRKDIINWKQACQFLRMYFDETYKMEDEFPANVSTEDRKIFLKTYMEGIDFQEDKDIWFTKVKNITGQMGYAANRKEYKKYPERYKGSIIDLTNILRIAITGRINAPDIWEISNVLGEKCVIGRIKKYL